MTIKKTTQKFHDGEKFTFRCPRGHTTTATLERADSLYPLPTFYGKCSDCESDWKDFMDDAEGRFEEIIDEELPDDPSYFVLMAQRIVDWNRKITDAVDDTDNLLPTRSSFNGMVTWSMDPDEVWWTEVDYDV